MASANTPRENGPLRPGSDLLRLAAPVAVVVMVGFFLAYRFVDPAPPERIVLATGEPDGAYAQFGEAYASWLAEFDIEVERVPTAGSKDGLARIAAGDVDVAFAQGGIDVDADASDYQSLGSLFFEPLWLFHRADRSPRTLAELDGWRVAVGPQGSGTRPVALDLLGLNRVDAQIVDLSIGRASQALRAGELDAAFVIASPRSDYVRELLLDPGIRAFSFERAEAYARLERHLSRVVLPEGVVDLARNVPSDDIHLVAPTANLVVSADLHPALIDLLLQAAQSIHAPGGILEAPGRFPTREFIGFPLNAEAARFYEYGPPFLQRYLPFWLATLVDRLKVMLIPLVALLIPVFRLFPPLYRWRVRSRIYRWYTELREIDPRNRSEFDVEQAIAKARRIEREVAEVEAPASYGEELYQLRLHVEFVQAQLADRRAGRLEDDDDVA